MPGPDHGTPRPRARTGTRARAARPDPLAVPDATLVPDPIQAPATDLAPAPDPDVPSDAAAAARTHTATAIAALAFIAAEGKSETARIAAAEALLNRAWGRPSAPPSSLPAGESGGLNVIVQRLAAPTLDA